jgi:C4-dicarboxylate transporter, DctM subunit
MSEVSVGIVGLVFLLALFLTGIELGFAMALVGFVGFSYIVSFTAASSVIAKDIFNVFSNYGYTVIPLFILMGQVAFNSGIAKRLFTASSKFVGHIPGGLAMATLVGATAFKAICGSSPATAATFAMVAVPEMDRHRYKKELSTGIVAVVGTLGVLLPPSVVLILFGIITEQSIGRLFLAGILPGLLIALFFGITIYGWCKLDPSVAPRGDRFPWKEKMRALPELAWVVILFLFLIGGLMKGLFTPTEAGSVVTFVVILVCVLKRDIGLKSLQESLIETLFTASMASMLIVGSCVLGHFLAVTTIPMVIAEWVGSLPLNRNLVMILIALVYLIGGSFIDDIAFMILATPIFYPAVIGLKFDPLWFGMVIAITLMIGVVIPPVALNVFIVKNLTKVPFGVIYRGVLPFLISLVLGGFLLFVFPQLATFLPKLLMK